MNGRLLSTYIYQVECKVLCVHPLVQIKMCSSSLEESDNTTKATYPLMAHQDSNPELASITMLASFCPLQYFGQTKGCGEQHNIRKAT